MNRLLLTPLWIFLAVFMLSCGPGSSKTNGHASSVSPMEKGKVIPRVTCQRDYSVSYALYLPKAYSAALRFPLIIAFDPQGNGRLPVDKYKDLADKYGYILMGSNDSKNGLDMNTTGAIIDALFGEKTGKYSIDSTRIYVLGFSGGARIASMIGLFQGGVAGVIGCGAGFPSTTQQASFKPDYISFAGNADFNMNELINLDRKLDEENFTHASILFNGKHAWPPADIMENAFIWSEFCAMRKGFIRKNDSMINNFIHSQKSIIEKDKETKDAIAENNHLINLIRFTNGLSPVDDLKKSLNNIENSPLYKIQEKQSQQLIAKEMAEQQSLSENFFPKEISWWKRKLSNYDLRIKKGKDSTDVRMCQRLKSFLSLISYMNYNRVLSSNDTIAAKHAMDIYEIVDPENAASTKADKRK